MKKSYQAALGITWGLVAVCFSIVLLMYVLSLYGIDWTEQCFFLVFLIPLFLILPVLLSILYTVRNSSLRGSQSLLAGECLAH